MDDFLERSYLQYKKHIELNHLKINFTQKILLILLFISLLPTFLLDLLLREKKSNKVYVMEYTNQEPYRTIYKYIRTSKFFNFIKINKFYIPIIPIYYYKDLLYILIKRPIFFFKNILFFSILGIRIAKYYSLIRFNDIKYLIVLQEYSFYISYVTKLMEKRNGKLYNIMHGIPGDTYCYFRFSKCFVWSEYFKEKYIQNRAYKEQFVMSGSLFHSYILKYYDKNTLETFDILYAMDGEVEGYNDVIEILEKLSLYYKVGIKQHPRQKVKLNTDIAIVNDDIVTSILKSKIIIGHYTTALLDTVILKKIAISYLGKDITKSKYIDYIDKRYIFFTKQNLLKSLKLVLSDKTTTVSYNKLVIDIELEPLNIIENIISKDILRNQ